MGNTEIPKMTDPNATPPTPEEVLAEVKKLAEERPDFVHTEQEGRLEGMVCGYVGLGSGLDEGEGCIVGQAMARCGVSPEWMLHTESTGRAIGASEIMNLLAGPPLGLISALNKLDAVQAFQDGGYCWSDAVEAGLSDRQGDS